MVKVVPFHQLMVVKVANYDIFPPPSLSQQCDIVFLPSKARMLIYEISLIGPQPMDISTPSTSQSCEIPCSDVTILEGHTSEVGYVII